MICARCNQVGCPNPQKVYMAAGQGDQCLEHLRARFTESEAALERVGYLKMDTEIAELQHKLKEAEKGREHDRQQFRQGADSWQRKITAAEESRGYWKNELRLLREKYARLREKVVDVEKRESEFRRLLQKMIDDTTFTFSGQPTVASEFRKQIVAALKE